MNINEEEQQLCRQEKELKSDEVIFQIPKEREEKNQHIRNDERHVDQLRQTKTKKRESTEKMEKGYWRLVGESETETRFSTNTRTNNKKKQHKVKKQRPGIKHKTKEATNTQKQKPLLCNDV